MQVIQLIEIQTIGETTILVQIWLKYNKNQVTGQIIEEIIIWIISPNLKTYKMKTDTLIMEPPIISQAI